MPKHDTTRAEGGRYRRILIGLDRMCVDLYYVMCNV